MPSREDTNNLLRNIPSVDEILSLSETQSLLEKYPRRLVVSTIRQVLEGIRGQLLATNSQSSHVDTSLDNITESLKEFLGQAARPSLRPLINATGVVIHTNLGRSLLADAAVEQMNAIAAGYSNLEFDLSAGRRGSRYVHVEEILRQLTGAEAALIVNNNAAAVLLVLDTLARGKEVIVSRGQLVEIGGSFRIPDIMARSGAQLVEVGTTNRTHPADYERAITENTAFLMKVHTSNFHIIGFTSEVPLADLVALGKRHGLPVVEDLGSGCFVDLSRYGLLKEPTVQEALQAGADIVTFSGDKLLGGPQAGIILGRDKFIGQVRSNPLNRALRIDKLTLAGLEATLRLYLDDEGVVKQIPTLRLLTVPIAEINKKALQLYRRLTKAAVDHLSLRVIDVDSQVGGGALPLQKLPSRAVAVQPKGFSVTELEARMRSLSRPVIGRIENDQFIMDMRTVSTEEIPHIVEAVKTVLSE
ncbi:MAG: L-seryl-tRNA(Sec) selenium transferase [Desulfovibrionales bacterium]|nr:L-seryl-tRNA(Sec) selenium transferase [Desulfovibrionales bacterium]